MSATLTDEDLVRYDRQIMLPGFGEEGQERLRRSTVFIAGAGGLGSPVAVYLACAGVGRIVLVDDQSVELSNLNRQILHWEGDIGEKKITSGECKLQKINSTIRLEPIPARITAGNILDLLEGVDLVMDCLDNMETRFIINAACFQKKMPLIHGGVRGLAGEITTIIPGETPCLECIFPRRPEKTEPLPVLGATAGLIASLQVMEAVKLISSCGQLLTGRMLHIDGGQMQFLSIQMKKNPQCPVCGGQAE